MHLNTSGPSRWSEVGRDPNDEEVVAWRRQRLRSAQKPPVRDRVKYIITLVQGRNVLDIGPVAHIADRHVQEEWLHKHVASAAARCLGVDILEKEVERLQAGGYHVRVCDVLEPEDRARLEGNYDIMVCGELIEHLDNPGALFTAAYELLAPGGRLVLTTPNPFYVWRVGRYLLRRANDSADHVTFLFPSAIAELAERHGLVLDAYRGSLIPGLSWKHYLAFRFGLKLRRAVDPDAFCPRMIYEVVHPGTGMGV